MSQISFLPGLKVHFDYMGAFGLFAHLTELKISSLVSETRGLSAVHPGVLFQPAFTLFLSLENFSKRPLNLSLAWRAPDWTEL